MKNKKTNMQPGKKPLSKSKKIIFGVVIILGILAIVELFSALYYYWRIPKIQRESVERALGLLADKRGYVHRFISHPYFTYLNNPEFIEDDGYRPNNSRGFRMPEWGEKKEGSIRIIVLGGSTTYGYYNKYGKDVWPAMLGVKLNEKLPVEVEVLNLGVNGYTINEIMGVLSMIVPSLSPDIILFHIGVNEAFAASYPDEGGPDLSNFRFAFKFEDLSGINKTLMRKSYFFRIIGMGLLKNKKELTGILVSFVQYSHPDEQTLKENFQKLTGKYFRQHLSTIIALSRNIKALPVIIPNPLQPKWEKALNIPLYYQYTNKVYKKFYRIMKEVVSKKKVNFIDLYTRMYNNSLFLDGVHVNEKGMMMKAELIKDGIVKILKDQNQLFKNQK